MVKPARTMTMAICAMLLLCAFAAAEDRDDREWRGEHPHYLHALSDLRAARGILDSIDPGVPFYRKVERIIADVDATMHEIQEAAISDGKDPRDYPPVDPTWDRGGRLRRASDFLDRAHENIAYAREPNDFARGLKRRADGHLEDARHRIHDLMRELHERREWQERREEHEEREEHRGY